MSLKTAPALCGGLEDTSSYNGTNKIKHGAERTHVVSCAAMLVVAALCLLAGAAAATAKPIWPPPIAPVWPTQFSSPVTGFDNDTSPTNFTGIFFYDWVETHARTHHFFRVSAFNGR